MTTLLHTLPPSLALLCRLGALALLFSPLFPRPCQAQPAPEMLVREAHTLAARERSDPTTAKNAPDRLRQLQNLLGAMRFTGAFTGLEQICPRASLAAMMRAQDGGKPEALPPLLSPCLRALGTLGRLSGPATAQAAPAMPAVSKTVSLPTTADRLFVSPAVPPQAPAPGGTRQAAFPETEVTATGGMARLTLTETPVYIEDRPRETPPSPAERLASPFGAHPATFRGENPPFALAHELGLGWHRGVAWWVDIQSDADLAAGRFDFSRLDAQLAAMGPDMRALLTIMLPARLRQDPAGGQPGQPGPLAAKADGSWTLGPPRSAYDAFIKALVRRYDRQPPAGVSRVAYWQFENELDLSRARNDAAGYAALQAHTNDLIKAVDPKATVLMGGVSGEDFATNFKTYYEPVLRRLHGKGFDVFDLHLFGRAGDYRLLDTMVPLARKALDANGFARAPIWMTETATYSGAPTAPPGLPPQTQAEQAAELVRRGVHALGLGVGKVFWAMVREGFHYRNDLFDHAGLTTNARVSPQSPDGTPKLAFFTYRRLCAKLAGCAPKPQRLDLGPGVFAYRFRAANGRTVIVAWADPRP